MLKRCLLLVGILAVSAFLPSCQGIPGGAAVSEVGTVSDQPGLSGAEASRETEPDCEEYLSTEGDGEILCLYGDGTFLAYTVTDLSADGEAGIVPFSMTERVTGHYTRTDDDLALLLSAITYSVVGLEEYPELVEAQASALAGSDEALHALYVKLFGGTELDGYELLGEEGMNALLETAVSVSLDKENATFTYKRTKAE